MPKVDGKEIGLFEFSKGFRNANVVRNKYNANDEYRAGHADATSDGDEHGKGENNGSVGSKTDITQRTLLGAKNTYSKDHPYDASRI